MARPEEIAQHNLNRWVAAERMKDRNVRGPRPYLASKCKNLRDAEFYRKQIITEISRKVTKIQDASLGEQTLRDLNDEINKKLREKRHWENQIVKLGGRNYKAKNTAAGFDADGRRVQDSTGYMYFGAAKDLPGVRELFQPQLQKRRTRTRHDIIQNVNLDYFGYRDEEDGVLLQVEAEAEKRAISNAFEDWRRENKKRRQAKRDAGIESSSEEDDDGEEDDAASFKVNALLLSQKDIKQILLKKRKEKLLKRLSGN
eukprot:g5320.t1